MFDPMSQNQPTEFLLYTAPNGAIKVEVLLSNETIWLTQKRMAELFGIGVPAISKHLKNIFDSGELVEEVVVSILETTTEHGAMAGLTQTQPVKYYNLDAVISVGYRVNSTQATQFRIWATQRIKDYIIKGFAMDDERLKNGRYFGKDYFRELLERVRSIRTSERRIYQQITDIFAECSIDYDPQSETTRLFYAHVQDKFHFAITGHTAAEIISLKADSSRPLMGMSTYKNAPDGRVLKSDSTVAKNYLVEADIKNWNVQFRPILTISRELSSGVIPSRCQDLPKAWTSFSPLMNTRFWKASDQSAESWQNRKPLRNMKSSTNSSASSPILTVT